MESGSRALIWLLAGALVAGAATVVFHPVYRRTAAAWARGEPERSPIWLSNAARIRDRDPDEEPDDVPAP